VGDFNTSLSWTGRSSRPHPPKKNNKEISELKCTIGQMDITQYSLQEQSM
jgi:hypothetical protein